MGSMLRSEEMALCQLFLQSESAVCCVSELGELGMVQFRDLNPDVNAFQRKFVNEVRRCDEMERKLRFLEREIKRDEIPMLDVGENPEAPQPREMIDLEATFEKIENELREVNTNSEALKKTYLELTELRHILKKTQQFFDEMQDTTIPQDDNLQLLGEEGLRAGGPPMKLGFVAGVILRERIPAFERMMWRVCRGNVFLRQAEIETPLEDPISGDNAYKSVFIIFFHGEMLKARVKKICEGFRATLYPCPDNPGDRREMIGGVASRLDDLGTVLNQTNEHRHRVLVAAAKNIRNWFVKVRKIKAIYHTLNMFNLDVTQKCLIAECWCPVIDLERIQVALRRGTERSGSAMPSILNRMETKETPPTYNRTNKFTAGFQAIVNAYGVATYREINPAPYTIVTFPFLFAVMFGDAGHGVLMLLFGAWMVAKERNLILAKTQNEIFKTFFDGRYMICLMGVFSIYTGLLYNDVFSKSINVFGSAWTAPPVSVRNGLYPESLKLDPKYWYDGDPYPIGVDPVWQVSENKITFLNSYKMKLSVVLGVSQMLFGVLLSFRNHRHFKSGVNIICEFIPQVIFLCSIFGYMVILIFYKWLAYSSEQSSCAPSVLISLINMVLFKYPKEPCFLEPMFFGQQFLQVILVLLALFCVPWMLAGKPYVLQQKYAAAIYMSRVADRMGFTAEENAQQQAHEQQQQQMMMGQMNDGQPPMMGDGQTIPMRKPLIKKVDPVDMGDLVIHQAIHTIEYCLGSISHTASYLRLWALSLAHAQLSEVLWSMVMALGMTGEGASGGIIMYIVFAFWAGLTVGVLLVMEGLSAFLHALRLHWVEFQSKFYKGEGYIFAPFAFVKILEAAEQEAID